MSLLECPRCRSVSSFEQTEQFPFCATCDRPLFFGDEGREGFGRPLDVAEGVQCSECGAVVPLPGEDDEWECLVCEAPLRPATAPSYVPDDVDEQPTPGLETLGNEAGEDPDVVVGGRCLACDEPNVVGATYCRRCGAALRDEVCRRCHERNPQDATHCARCGTPLRWLPPAAPSPTSAPDSATRELDAGLRPFHSQATWYSPPSVVVQVVLVTLLVVIASSVALARAFFPH